MLFVETKVLKFEAKKKPRLMHSTTIEMSNPDFKLSVEKLAILTEMEERIMGYLAKEGIEL